MQRDNEAWVGNERKRVEGEGIEKGNEEGGKGGGKMKSWYVKTPKF